MVTDAPEREIGYAHTGPSFNSVGGSWFDDGEKTPELQWPRSVEVYDQMRTQDAQVGSVLEAVIRPVLRTPWRVDPAGARPEVVRFVADDLGLPIVGENPTPPPRTKDRFSWLEHLELAMLMLPFGHMFFEMVYRVDDDGGRAHLRKLGPRMPRTIDEINVARDGGLISIRQIGTMESGTQLPIPVSRLVAYVYKREGGNWIGRSILRQAYKNWLLKDRLLRVGAQTIERNGMGVPLYEAAESETDLSRGLAMATAWRSGEASGSAIPNGAKLSLVGVTGELPDSLPHVEYHDNQIARAVLAHFLNLGQQAGTGSYALGVTFADFFTLSLQTLAQQVADTATQHIVEDLVDVNWGAKEPAPRVTFDEIGSRQAATAQAIKLLVDAGVIHPDQVLEESSRQQFGLPPADPATATEPPGDGGLVSASAGGVDPKGGGPAGADDEELTDDELVDALVVAMAEYAGETLPVFAATWNPALHPRGRKGRFRTTIDKLIDALNRHNQSGGTGDPFKGFERETLRRAAVKRGLTVPRGASRDDIRDLLVADLSGKGPSGQTAAPATSKLPAGTTKVASNVAGTTGVTQTVVTPPAVFGAPSWMTPTQTLEIQLNGTKIGKLERYSYGWHATTAAGNPVTSGRTKTAALQALVQHHQSYQALRAPVPATAVAGVTLTRRPPVFGNAPNHYQVEHQGVDVGHVHGDDSDPTDTWTAFPPTGAAWGLQSNPGSGQTYATRDDAIQGLVDAHTAFTAPPPPPPAPSSIPGLPPTRVKLVTRSGGSATYDVFAGWTASPTGGGAHIGQVEKDPRAFGGRGGWTAHANPATFGAPGQAVPGGPFRTRQDAVTALNAYVVGQALSAPAGTPAAPSAPAIGAVKFHSVPGMANDYLVTAGGTDIGVVTASRQGWTARPPSGSAWTVANPGPHKTRKAAGEALATAYQTHITPVPAPAASRSPQVDPAVKSAQDVLYGIDPKGKTAARQLQVYGGLSKAQYDTLDSNEKSTLLGDLSFIATTAKGPNAAKAQKLIDRFTPAGTPAGAIPKQSITPPANVVSAQTRVSDPAGTPGLLKMLPSGQRGANGDGWTRTTSGGSGPWGQYGAAGLLLRNVDAQGVERFLMIERGAGISDPYKWQFPGGAKDELEDFYQGAAREVIEELGFKPTDLDQARVHGTHSNEAPNVMVRGMHGGQVPWAYVSIAATVPMQLKPDLSTTHARLETNDAKWMTRAEIEALDRNGKLLRPLAGGALQTNVMSLFPQAGPARPAPRTTRPPRLTGNPSAPTPAVAHKVHRAPNLVATKAEQDQVRATVSANRKRFRGKSGDERLSALAEMQGFDGTPTVLSKAEVDRLLKTGDYIEAWRGVSGGWGSGSVSAAKINEQMRSGTAYFGTGVFGNGYYLATDKSVARQYSDGTKNSIARVLIPKAAFTRRPGQIKPLADASSSSNRTIYNGHRQGNGLGTLRDPGRYMAAAGIDGMEIPYDTQISWASARHIGSAGHPAYNWVNRTILIVQEADP